MSYSLDTHLVFPYQKYVLLNIHLVSTSKKNIRILFVIEINGFVGTPGGGLNKGESPWVAFKREFTEEVGLFTEKNNLDENKFYDFGNTRIFYGEIYSDVKYSLWVDYYHYHIYKNVQLQLTNCII